MDPRHLELATAFCQRVGVDDLYQYLSLSRDASKDDVLAALKKQRRRMQAMQNNPKFKEEAKYVIKHYRALMAVAEDMPLHLKHARKEQDAVHLPALEMAIEGVLADGVITPQEAAYVREMGRNLGISPDTVDRIFQEKAKQNDVAIPEIGDPNSDDEISGVHPAVSGPISRKRARAAATHAWWDATFSAMLLDAIPEGAGLLLDVYCRNAWSALTLLPQRPELRYVGLDRNAERLALAEQSLKGLNGRAELFEGYPQRVPLPDESTDIVLAMRAMQNQPDTTPIFAEAVRVLKPGGRLIIVEPDGLAEQFYFNGHLGDYNAAVHGLFQAIDHAMGERSAEAPPMGKPGLALGPSLPLRMEAAGIQVRSVHVHASTNLRSMSSARLLRRLRTYPRAMARASGLEDDHAALGAVYEAADRLAAELGDDQRGVGGNMLPLFMVAGIKT